MEFVEVIEQKERMCKHYYSRGSCHKCPIGQDNNGTQINCVEFIRRYPEKAEELIMEWAEENPLKTNGSHFLEEFPKAWVSERKYNSDNTIMVCVHLNLPGVFIQDDSIYFPAEWWDAEYKEVPKNAEGN